MARTLKDWFVYLVECSDETLYCGVTTNILRRIKQHNGKIPRGARYCAGRRPVKLRYFSQFGSRSKAQREETRIKKLSKERKWELISKFLGVIFPHFTGE